MYTAATCPDGCLDEHEDDWVGFNVLSDGNQVGEVDLKVKIGIPGSWFGAGNSKALTATGKKERYEAIAVEYEENHIFEQICSYLQLSTDTGSDS